MRRSRCMWKKRKGFNASEKWKGKSCGRTRERKCKVERACLRRQAKCKVIVAERNKKQDGFRPCFFEFFVLQLWTFPFALCTIRVVCADRFRVRAIFFCPDFPLVNELADSPFLHFIFYRDSVLRPFDKAFKIYFVSSLHDNITQLLPLDRAAHGVRVHAKKTSRFWYGQTNGNGCGFFIWHETKELKVQRAKCKVIMAR